jgi:hypothetical protein
MNATDDQMREVIDSAAGDPGEEGARPQAEGLSAGEAAGSGGVMGGPTDGVNEIASTTAAGLTEEDEEAMEANATFSAGSGPAEMK